MIGAIGNLRQIAMEISEEKWETEHRTLMKLHDDKERERIASY